jgi:hypothetical protein
MAVITNSVLGNLSGKLRNAVKKRNDKEVTYLLTGNYRASKSAAEQAQHPYKCKIYREIGYNPAHSFSCGLNLNPKLLFHFLKLGNRKIQILLRMSR